MVSTVTFKEMQEGNNVSYPRRSRRLHNKDKAVTVQKSDKTSNSINVNIGKSHKHNDTVDWQAEQDAVAITDHGSLEKNQEQKLRKNKR